MEAPVLLITFNRADHTRKVFDKIREVRVKKLYVANDAPRDGNNEDRVNREKIRNLLDEIDWDCELKTLFHEKNCGNGFGPVAAFNWAFETEEKLIILEDDCVPSLPFFDFTNHCLTKYSEDERIWIISGRSHHTNHSAFENYDYIFSLFAHTWGWATWKRCWKHFDMNMNEWSTFKENGGFENVFMFENEGKMMNQFYSRFVQRPINSWDARWGFTVHSNSGYGIVPAKNLIENIGYYGAHTNGKQKTHELSASHDYKIGKEPHFVVLNREYERFHFNKHIKKIFGKRSLFVRIALKVKRTIESIF